MSSLAKFTPQLSEGGLSTSKTNVIDFCTTSAQRRESSTENWSIFNLIHTLERSDLWTRKTQDNLILQTLGIVIG